MELNSDTPEVSPAGGRETDDERRLVDAMASFNIELRVLARHVGPRTITYRVMPAPGVTVSAIMRRALDVGVQLSTASCTAREEQGRMFVEVSREDMDIPTFESIPRPDDPEDILVGVDALGAPVTMRLEKMPSAILAGSSGSGKSTALRVLISGLTRHRGLHHVLICDPKNSGEFEQFAGPHVGIARNARDCGSLIYTLGEVLDLSIGRKLPREVTATANDMFVSSPSGYVLIVDEVQAIEGRSVLKALNNILAMGRSSGMHCILATQHPSAAVLGNEMRVNCPTRLVFRVASQSDSRVALGDSGAERLLGLGDGLLRYLGQVTRIQVPSIG